eukprot:TRINITY_DN110737_c0_g1_i1.p1 TRINITY_DN110737_c0_g1~~TRINITY_DN110737_c0_g1_i1.p1  ORF type:complete len:915 (-),score=192.49 TRINITY_DN110737_c0_g1_i1:235-2928(-)
MAPHDKPPPASSTRHGAARHGAQRRAGAQVRLREVDKPRPRSEAFEAYYKAQRVVPEEEWDDFLGTLRTPLPRVVRLNRTKPHWKVLQESFEADDRWTSLSWLPNAWKCPEEHFNHALQQQCASLNKAYALRYQEAASLVPPLMLGLSSDDVVLDMCAAPGSKTLECLELMRPDGGSSDGGVVIANDADAERCFELLPMITRKARHPGTIVTLASATKFPPMLEAEGDQFLFDKIVCDVPCSGDGTLRKQPYGWASWSTKSGMALHAKQLQILCKGLHMLKPGGRLSYSTCSMNPMENEAVVAAALMKYKDDVELQLHARDDLEAKGLKTRAGLTHWLVAAPEGCGDKFFSSWEDVPADERRPKGVVCETMFPPGDSDLAKAVLASLPRGCVRLDPHSIDGSGFFVAVFVKKHHRLPPFDATSVQADPTADRRLAWRARNDANHYEVIEASSDEVNAIASFYGIKAVPSPLIAEFNIKGRLSQVNLVNARLLKLLRCRLQCKASPLLISVGVPLFKPLNDNFMTEVDVPCRWRPALEGAAILAPLMKKRVLRLDADVMSTLLVRRVIPMQELQRLASSGEVAGIESFEGLLGGGVVGLKDDNFWAPCVITGTGLELYANADELGSPKPELLPPLSYDVILKGAGYTAVSKPSGLRSEDVLFKLRKEHSDAELVSRLDQGTSGCMIVPTQKATAAKLTEQFSSSSVTKTYLALVWGRPPAEGVLDAPLALAENSGGGARYRAYVDAENGKKSETRFRTLWSGRRFSLVLAMPVTGRTHQIRCHLANAGHALVGDDKYGDDQSAKQRPTWCSRLLLHCFRVQARDDLDGVIDATAALPPDFEAALDVVQEEQDGSCGETTEAAAQHAAASWRDAMKALRTESSGATGGYAAHPDASSVN